MLTKERPQPGEGQRDRARRVPPLVAQEEKVVPYLCFIQRRRVGSEVPTDQDDITQVGLASARPQIAQLDKAAKFVYGCIMRMRDSR